MRQRSLIVFVLLTDIKYEAVRPNCFILLRDVNHEAVFVLLMDVNQEAERSNCLRFTDGCQS